MEEWGGVGGGGGWDAKFKTTQNDEHDPKN